MTSCESVATVLARYQGILRHRLPDWLKNPSNQDQWNLAFALASAPYGIRPVCQDGILTGWEGIGFRVREAAPKPPAIWSPN